MCGVPPQEGGEGSGGGEPPLARHHAGISIRSVEVATASCRGSYHCARQSEICGQSHRWRREPLAPHSHGGSGSSRLSTRYDFRAPFKRLFSCPPRLPETMRATGILNCLGFVLKRQRTAAAFHVQTSSGADGKHCCETPRLAPSPVLFGVREALILTSSKAKSLSSSMLLSANY